jgi:two-component system chemotaxis response regulator CheB
LASNLTEAYNAVEHDRPDCFVIAAALAASPDFELLDHLLKQLDVGCIVWGGGSQPLAPIDGFSHHHFDLRRTTANLNDVILSATKTRPIKTAQMHRNSQVGAYDPRHIVMIGASTGGVDALAKVLNHFNKLTPPTLIVQHTGGRFVNSLIRLLDNATDAMVEPAVHDAPLKTGTVYFSPCDTLHLGISKKCGKKIALAATDPVSGHRPSVDMLFRSAVPRGHHIAAALLTGMGQDGARGLKALRDVGAHTIAQDKATSVVYGMPRIAAEIGAAVEQLPLEQIGPALLSAAKLKVRV